MQASHIHVRDLVAKGGSGTQGVGESIVQYVEEHGMDLCVVGSRGCGSIKRWAGRCGVVPRWPHGLVSGLLFCFLEHRTLVLA